MVKKKYESYIKIMQVLSFKNKLLEKGYKENDMFLVNEYPEHYKIYFIHGSPTEMMCKMINNKGYYQQIKNQMFIIEKELDKVKTKTSFEKLFEDF